MSLEFKEKCRTEALNHGFEFFGVVDAAELAKVPFTDDDIRDTIPDINDHGVITWSRAIGPVDPDTGQPTLEIVIYEDGDLTRVTDNAVRDWGCTSGTRCLTPVLPRFYRTGLFHSMTYHTYTTTLYIGKLLKLGHTASPTLYEMRDTRQLWDISFIRKQRQP